MHAGEAATLQMRQATSYLKSGITRDSSLQMSTLTEYPVCVLKTHGTMVKGLSFIVEMRPLRTKDFTGGETVRPPVPEESDSFPFPVAPLDRLLACDHYFPSDLRSHPTATKQAAVSLPKD